MNYPTLEKTLVPLPLFEFDKKKVVYLKEDVKRWPGLQGVDPRTMKGVRVC
jgi:hypothetical protein